MRREENIVSDTYEQILKEIKNLRKELHACPEKSGSEKETMKRLKDFLKTRTSLKIIDCDTWFYAVHEEEGAWTSKAFRADMDAVMGEDGRLFHGCGHDGHSAVLVGLCLLLEGRKTGSNVYAIFQPAEETGQGAKICSRLLEEKGIREIYGFHNLPGYPAGKAVVKKGTFACASRGLILNLEGRQCHAAYPEEGINPAWLIAELISSLPSLTEKAGSQGMVLATIIEVKAGGENFGVSPADGKLALTIRAERLSELNRLQSSILSLAQKRSVEGGLKFQYQILDEFPDTYNEHDMADACKRRFEEGKIPYLEENAPFRWSEDFGWYLMKTPGLFFGVGAGEDCPGLHTAAYEFPDEIMESAVRAFEALL